VQCLPQNCDPDVSLAITRRALYRIHFTPLAVFYVIYNVCRETNSSSAPRIEESSAASSRRSKIAPPRTIARAISLSQACRRYAEHRSERGARLSISRSLVSIARATFAKSSSGAIRTSSDSSLAIAHNWSPWRLAGVTPLNIISS